MEQAKPKSIPIKHIKVPEFAGYVANLKETAVFKWEIKPGDTVKTNELIGIIQTSIEKCKILSHIPGTLISVPMNPQDPLIINIEKCDHECSFNGLCAICGEEIPKNEDHKRYIGIGGKTLKYSGAHALKQEKRYMEKLFDDKKLLLVLDIDNTLIHALEYRHPDIKNAKDIQFFNTENGEKYALKKRPFCDNFLKAINGYFDVFVYSHGCQFYVDALVKILDPEGKILNKNKVIGREQIYDQPMLKSLEKILPSADQAFSIIIDDRDDVWADKLNLITIFPYVYFDSEQVSYDRRKYGKISPRSRDSSLLYYGYLLRNINALFYQLKTMNLRPNVQEIIKEIRRNLLKGVRINLDAIYPDRENLLKSCDYKMLMRVGGEYTSELENTIILTTEFKEENSVIQKAISQNQKIVSSWWLILSIRDWRKLPLEPFYLTKENPRGNIDEIGIATKVNELLEKDENWKYENFSEIIKELSDSRTTSSNENLNNIKPDEPIKIAKIEESKN